MPAEPATANGTAAAALVPQLHYWLAYAALCAAIRVLQPILNWVPFVTHLQLLTVLWLQLPFLRAATQVFTQLLSPLQRSGARSAANEGEGEAARAPRANALYSSRLLDSSRLMTAAHADEAAAAK